jgi:hypothetical protein
MSSEIHEELIDKFSTMIEHPVSINKKTGYKLSNGITILFNDNELSQKSRNKLSRHYKKKGIK